MESNSNPVNLANQLNNYLIVLDDWIKFNKLAFNLDKTKCMLFSFQNVVYKPVILINTVTLEYVSSMKYLGLTLDDRLSFKSHIASLKSKLAFYQRLIYSLKQYLSFNALKSMYFAFVYLQLFLHLILWGGAAPTHIETIQVAQNKIICTINKFDYVHTDDLFQQFGILKISEIYKFQCLLFMYKWIRCNNINF